MIHEIKGLIWLETPKGQGIAKFLIDHGIDSDLYWVVFINETNECWTFANYDVRVSNNITLGREGYEPEKKMTLQEWSKKYYKDNLK